MAAAFFFVRADWMSPQRTDLQALAAGSGSGFHYRCSAFEEKHLDVPVVARLLDA